MWNMNIVVLFIKLQRCDPCIKGYIGEIVFVPQYLLDFVPSFFDFVHVIPLPLGAFLSPFLILYPKMIINIHFNSKPKPRKNQTIMEK